MTREPKQVPSHGRNQEAPILCAVFIPGVDNSTPRARYAYLHEDMLSTAKSGRVHRKLKQLRCATSSSLESMTHWRWTARSSIN